MSIKIKHTYKKKRDTEIDNIDKAIVIHLMIMDECTRVQPLMFNATKSYWAKTISTQTHITEKKKEKDMLYKYVIGNTKKNVFTI